MKKDQTKVYNVLHVYKTFLPESVGGMEVCISEMCQLSAGSKFRHSVFSLSDRRHNQVIFVNDIPVHLSKRIGKLLSCDIGGLSSLINFYNLARKADIIQFYHPWPFISLLLMLVPKTKPVILFYVSDVVRQKVSNFFYSPLFNLVIKRADTIVVNSPNYLDKSPMSTNSIFMSKVKVLPLGLNDKASLQLNEDDSLTKFGIIKNEKYILFVGALRYYKTLENLIEASSRISHKILIVGDGERRKKLEEIVKKNDYSNVLFLGLLPEVEKHKLLKHASVFVLPSSLRSEAYGMVLVESLMHGVPLVTCDISTGTSFINKNNETGFVVQPSSSIELAQAINNLLSDEELRTKFSVAARLRYENYFSKKALKSRYEKLWSENL